MYSVIVTVISSKRFQKFILSCGFVKYSGDLLVYIAICNYFFKINKLMLELVISINFIASIKCFIEFWLFIHFCSLSDKIT